MRQHQAIEMLALSEGSYSASEVWADLGCGSGTFTLALAHQLGEGGQIYAVDKNRQMLNNIPASYNSVAIEKKEANFEQDALDVPSLDGILMANSLHYVSKQEKFVVKAKQWLKPTGRFLMVEYDTNSSNPWIPYPVGWNRLNELFSQGGFTAIRKIREVPSRVNRANLYSAIIER